MPTLAEQARRAEAERRLAANGRIRLYRRGSRGMSVRDRFEAQFMPEPNSGCWLWIAVTNCWGYGMIKDSEKIVSAHRLSWRLHRGDIPDGLQVLHRCDTPACVNPDHLFLGTQADNMADLRAKGRGVRGERNVHAKLTEDEVRAIRRDPRKQAEIASTYGVSDNAIAHIQHRRSWAHVT